MKETSFRDDSLRNASSTAPHDKVKKDYELANASSREPEKGNMIALVAVVKNEGRYLEEWIGYHLMLGVDHVYLYDDGSTDDSAEAYKTMYKTGRLTVHRAIKTGRRHNMQEDCNEEWRRRYGHLYKFVMPWDADEFLSLKVGVTLQEFLEAIPDNVGQVRLNWKLFGSGGHRHADYNRLVIDRFTTHCTPDFDRQTKLIVRLEALGGIDCESDRSRPITVHHSSIMPGYISVGGDLRTVVEDEGTMIAHTIWEGWAVCNHYSVKSFEEFVTIKKTKSVSYAKPDLLEAGSVITQEYFDLRDRNEITDEKMRRHVAPLRKYIDEVRAIILPYG